MGFMKEFKDFALKGNVMDMAVGVIIGAAFGNIVTSLTTSFINPVISLITGGAQKDENGNMILVGGKFTINGVDFDYGGFISAVLNFLIIALILFCIIKAVNKASEAAAKAAEKLKKEKAEEEAAAPEEPSDEVKLLTEIKDILSRRA